MKSILAAAALTTAVTAGPASLRPRDTFCGQWDLEVAGPYTVYNNLWGMDNAESGEQCTTNNGLASDGSLSWSVDWTWVGGQGQVKSYPNVVVDADAAPRPLSDISSITAAWDWTYTGQNFIANVAFDIFTASTAEGSPEYEIMVWLGAFGGAGPISETGSPIGTANLAGTQWNLFYGSHSQMEVYSFVASSGNVQSFDGDLTEFSDFLTANHGLASSQLVQSVGGGTEPFEGVDVTFATSRYVAQIN